MILTSDYLVFYGIIILMILDVFTTNITLKLFRDSGEKNWWEKEFSYLHRPILKKFGLEFWTYFAIICDTIFFLGMFFVFQKYGNFDFVIRMYYLLFGIYIITVPSNYMTFLIVKRKVYK